MSFQLPPVKWEPVNLPNGGKTTFDEMREGISEDFYRQGDAILVWVNEGDILWHTLAK
jgi:hypothetical protein